MTASHLVIHQIRNMIEGGQSIEDVAEATVLPVAQVKRVMRAYDIRLPVKFDIPRPALRRLMAGR